MDRALFIRNRMRRIEEYLAPLMGYEDEGAWKIPHEFWPEAMWIYDYYLSLKEEYSWWLKSRKKWG